MKIAIIGKGNVGSALEAGFSRNGHEVRAVGKAPGAVREAGEFGDIVVLAVPFSEVGNAVASSAALLRARSSSMPRTP